MRIGYGFLNAPLAGRLFAALGLTLLGACASLPGTPDAPRYLAAAAHCKVADDSGLSKVVVHWSGSCSAGFASGAGVARWYVGDQLLATYDGPMVRGLMEGEGRYAAASGEIYEGQFHQHRFEGRGYFKWPTGDSYQGDFLRGLRTGEGQYTWENGNTYIGSFVAGLFEGLGEKHWAEGTSWSGQWHQGVPSGTGRYHSTHGDEIEGEWLVDHLQNGPVSYHWADGRLFQGSIEGGLPQGQGLYRDAAGREYSGLWRGGVLETDTQIITIKPTLPTLSP